MERSEQGFGGFGVRMGEASTGNYFDAIGKIDVLTAEQELSLAREVHYGLDLQWQIAEGTLEWTDRLQQYIDDGVTAQQIMVVHNLRLVPAIAAKYVRRAVGIDDLIQEGNMYLLTIVRGFDPDRGNRFSTYAVKALDNRLYRVSRNPRLLHETDHDSLEEGVEQGASRVVRGLGDSAAQAAMELYDERALVGQVLHRLYPADETLPQQRQIRNAERRTILYLAWVEGKRAPEIAAMFGKEAPAIRAFVSRKAEEAKHILATTTAED